MRPLTRGFVIFIGLLFVLTSTQARLNAQTETPPPPTLPDLTGLTVPQATARLNTLGVKIGTITLEEWSSAVSATPNTIAQQQPAAHTLLSDVSQVDFVVWQEQNARLIYDGNSLTLINLNNADLSLRRVVFKTLDGQGSASFNATEWRNRLNASSCMQLWSVPRSSGESRAGCRALQQWLSRTNSVVHFWTGSQGATQFEVRQDGILRGICTIAAGECSFYLAPFMGKSGIASDAAEYVYLSYTKDWLTLQNRTPDRWLPLNEITLNNSRVILGNVATYDNQPMTSAFPLLAPGECIALQRRDLAPTAPPPDCAVVATLSLAPAALFWMQPFTVTSRIDGTSRTCPAADGERALCLVPRLQEPE